MCPKAHLVMNYSSLFANIINGWMLAKRENKEWYVFFPYKLVYGSVCLQMKKILHVKIFESREGGIKKKNAVILMHINLLSLLGSLQE